MKNGHNPHDEVIRRAVLAFEAAGKGPTAEALAESPLLVNWQIIMMAGRLCLAGEVSGHPKLKDDFITTSHLVFLSPGLDWARTMSRFYRLGSSLGAMLARIDAFKGRNLELTDVYGWPALSLEDTRRKLEQLAKLLRAEGQRLLCPPSEEDN